jgi:hypothetical protein
MPLFQCFNPDCSGSEYKSYIFENKLPICTKCQGTIPDVSTVVMVHLGYYDRNGSMKGFKGRKVAIACGTAQYSDPFNSISVNPSVINCPQCMASEPYKMLWAANPTDINSFYKNPNLTKEEKHELLR